MPAPIDRSNAPKRERGTEPLRRKPVTLAPAGSRRRRIVHSILIFAAVVLLVDALVGDTGMVERLRARRQVQDAEASLAALRQENARMREYLRRLREDPVLIEALAREELGLIRPGELLFIVRDAQKP